MYCEGTVVIVLYSTVRVHKVWNKIWYLLSIKLFLLVTVSYTWTTYLEIVQYGDRNMKAWVLISHSTSSRTYKRKYESTTIRCTFVRKYFRTTYESTSVRRYFRKYDTSVEHTFEGNILREGNFVDCALAFTFSKRGDPSARLRARALFRAEPGSKKCFRFWRPDS